MSDKEEPLSSVELMVLILEDRRFFRHKGVDWVAVLRELIRALAFRKYGGASTIEMQFIRTCTGFRVRTIRRKIYEALLARIHPYRHSKISTLRSYLSIVFLGSGLYGVDAASIRLFGKDARELDPNEAAWIAAMMVYPRPLSPTPVWQQRVERRSRYALRLLPRFKDELQEAHMRHVRALQFL